MNRRRRLVTVLAVAVAASLTLGAGGYSSATADRDVTVTVVDDESAYLGVVRTELRCNETRPLIVNQFGGSLAHVELTFTTTGGELRVGTNGGSHVLADGDPVELAFDDVGAGEAVSVGVTRNGNATAPQTVGLDVQVTDGEVGASLDRTLTVAC